MLVSCRFCYHSYFFFCVCVHVCCCVCWCICVCAFVLVCVHACVGVCVHACVCQLLSTSQFPDSLRVHLLRRTLPIPPGPNCHHAFSGNGFSSITFYYCGHYLLKLWPIGKQQEPQSRTFGPYFSCCHNL